MTVINESKDPSPVEISDSWKNRFELLEKIGADKKSLSKAINTPQFKELTYKEKSAIKFNALAFTFFPFYYFFKKMWYKGTMLLGLSLILGSTLAIIQIFKGTSLSPVIYWAPGAIISGRFANYDYFKQVTQNKKIWSSLPNFLCTLQGAIIFVILSLLLFLFLLSIKI